MPARDLVIGLDCSTTACKAVVWDRTGTAVASGRVALSMSMPHPGWHEQPAGEWWTAAAGALRAAAAQVDTARLAALCIAAQRETFVVVDAQDEPLGSALLWMDERCRDLLPEIDRQYGAERVHRETGKPLSANLSLGKLFWLREHQPEMFGRIAQVVDVHAFLARKLTGRYATAWGCADPMGLFDMTANRWNAGLLHLLGLSSSQFPEAAPSGTLIGELLPAAAQECGLTAGLPLVAGLGDGQAAGLGVNAAHPGEAYLNLGTAVVSGTFSSRYVTDRAFRSMYGGIPGSYVLETVLLGGTYTVSWFLEKFGRPGGERMTEEQMEAAAREIRPGADGLVLVPYWNSAMNPYWDASASGIVAGWRGIHGQAHLYRAILEGIALEQRLHTAGVETALGQPIERFLAVGGGARSQLWPQIIADVTGRPVYRANAPEATALGAGILAAAGAGLYASVSEAAQAMTSIQPDPFVPDPARAAFYTRLYEEVYRDLYPALRAPLARLATFTQDGV